MSAAAGSRYERALRASFSAQATTRAYREHNRYLAFCNRIGIDEAAGTSRVLFLTWLVDSEGRTGKQVQRLLTDLDVAAQLEGQQRWRDTPDVIGFLPGLYRDHGLGPSGERADPLYRELVSALVDAIMTPSRAQVRDQAAVLLVNHARLKRNDLTRLLWRDITLRRDSVTIALPLHIRRQGASGEPIYVTVPAQRGPLCLVAVVRQLREHGGSPHGRVFPAENASSAGQPNQRVSAAVRKLDRSDFDLPALVQALGESPRQIRDRALVLLAYSAGLGAQETTDLRQGDITITPDGLILQVPRRPDPCRIATNPGMADDPVRAWQSWTDVLTQHQRAAPEQPAFPRTWKRHSSTRPLQADGLNMIIHRAAAAAGLDQGHYAYSSLRWGLIRTSFRADEPLHLVAQQVGLTSLNRIARHHRREHLIRRSVAGQLGL